MPFVLIRCFTVVNVCLAVFEDQLFRLLKSSLFSGPALLPIGKISGRVGSAIR
ncbi:hypothetical protein KR52_03800 [Synechococcus sp. KORDI-52]|nr:hypothetical protein KR52_03800 [Synechococcus sp. KORDI-52]